MRVSSDVLAGVGAIVTHDVSSKCVVAGNPAKVISKNGSAAFVGSFHPFSHKYEGLQQI